MNACCTVNRSLFIIMFVLFNVLARKLSTFNEAFELQLDRSRHKMTLALK